MAMALVDRALRARELGEEAEGAGPQDEEFVLSHSDNVQATGFVEHLKLPHYVDFQAELVSRLRRDASARTIWLSSPGRMPRIQPRSRRPAAWSPTLQLSPILDEQTKRMIRRAILKAIAIPGYQVPFRLARNADALWLGHRRRAGDRGHPRARRPC